ncbi:hypothetical protein GF362_02110 [Candidatus Dojkabacteria bacterium]|nr:hypothetical protein [Candidatus Dojkabacteria bacterium]
MFKFTKNQKQKLKKPALSLLITLVICLPAIVMSITMKKNRQVEDEVIKVSENINLASIDNTFNKHLLSESGEILDQSGEIIEKKVLCGPIDENQNEKIDLDDFTNFTKVYQKTCSDIPKYNGCGPKDADSNGRINIVDLHEFIRMNKLNNCTSK